MSVPPVTEAELNAYVDAVLPPARAAEVEAYLAERPDEAARVASYREQAHALRREFDQVLDEPVPERLRPPPPARALRRYAAVLAWIVLGGAIGWQLQRVRGHVGHTLPTFRRRVRWRHVS